MPIAGYALGHRVCPNIHGWAAGNVRRAKHPMKRTARRSRRASCSVLAVAIILLVSNLFAKEGLQIEKAYFGAAGSWRDLTAFLQSQVRGDTLSVAIAQPFEEIGGDPAFGQGKRLLIDYRLNGKEFRLLLEEQYPIAFSITLPSPDAVSPGAVPRGLEIIADVSAHPAVVVGPQSAPVTTTIALAAMILLLTLACSVLSLVLAIRARPRNSRWSAALAAAAVMVSIMGLVAWTPLGSFPEVGYTWSNGAFEISARSGWLFLVPLLVGTVALVLAAWRPLRRNEIARPKSRRDLTEG